MVSHATRPPATDDSSAAIAVSWVAAIGCGLAVIVALAVSTQTYLSMLDHGHSFGRILLWQLISWVFWAVAAPYILRWGAQFASRDQRTWREAVRLIVRGTVLTALHAALVAQVTIWTQPLLPVVSYRFGDAFVTNLPERLAIDPALYLLLLVVGGLLFTHHRSRQLLLRESRLEAELARAQLHALRLEIEPHFLFNTLNSICALIRLNDNARALEMLVGLSEFMRGTLDGPREPFAALSAEIEWVARYVGLQQLRFADRLTVEYRVDNACADVLVPSLLLQPLVENAMRHGASRQARPCRIEIGAMREGSRLLLWVADDGAGLPESFDLERSVGTGLRNTRSRLEQLYGPAATLEVGRLQSSGTRVAITMPCEAPRWTRQATA